MRLIALILSCLLALPAGAQTPARLDMGVSAIVATGQGWGGPPPLELRLTLSAPVPYRAYLVADPVRLIVDLKNVDLDDARPDDLFGRALVPGLRWGRHRQGWSRIVVELPGTYRIATAGQRTMAMTPDITVALTPVRARDFSAPQSSAAALRDLPAPADLPPTTAPGPLHVVLDPGHGGFDPGAEYDGNTEADLVLGFAREVRSELQARGVTVTLTRDDDSFLRLEQRTTLSRAAGADLFVSLHADALPSGQAAGATIYVWNPASDDKAARQLAQRHDRDDLIAGLDLKGQDDALASILMDMVRTDTQPRSENFAGLLVSRMALMGIGLHGRPVQGAAFSVLKSPDVPSALLELGFISDATDRVNLSNPVWRSQMVRAIADAVTGWARDEAIRAAMLRR